MTRTISGLQFVFVLMLSAVAYSADLHVGPGQPNARIEDAIAKAAAGDSIIVHPQSDGKPYQRVALFIKTARLTIRPADKKTRIALSGDGFDYSGKGHVPRAIVQFSKGADGCVIEGFELSGAHNDSFNGAGVRIVFANDVTVRDCDIHDNDMGIMSSGDGTQQSAVNQLIERCRIHSNGTEKDPGYNHNLYLGGTSVKLIGCEVFNSLTGHNVKSRAHNTIVMACYVHDSANREFDLVDAGDTAAPNSDAAIVGCVIVKSTHGNGNHAVIHFGQDGGKEHDGTIWLANNTILTQYVSAVLTLDAPKTRSRWLNNIVCDPTGKQANQVLLNAKGSSANDVVDGSANVVSRGFADPGLKQTVRLENGKVLPFVNPAKEDYRLKQPIASRGVALPDELRKLIGAKLWEYESPTSMKERKDADQPAIGAFE